MNTKKALSTRNDGSASQDPIKDTDPKTYKALCAKETESRCLQTSGF